MKSKILLLSFLFSIFSVTFAQEISDSLVTEKDTILDPITTLRLAEEDSLKKDSVKMPLDKR